MVSSSHANDNDAKGIWDDEAIRFARSAVDRSPIQEMGRGGAEASGEGVESDLMSRS